MVTVAVGDPGRTGVVVASVVVLGVLGIVLAATAVWLYRSTAATHRALGPLELMGERSWRRSDPVFQRRQLDAVRPEGAEPDHWSQPVPEPDAEFDRGPGLGDVAELAEPAAEPDAEPDAATDADVAS